MGRHMTNVAEAPIRVAKRVAIVDSDGEVILDMLVQPPANYNPTYDPRCQASKDKGKGKGGKLTKAEKGQMQKSWMNYFQIVNSYRVDNELDTTDLEWDQHPDEETAGTYATRICERKGQLLWSNTHD